MFDVYGGYGVILVDRQGARVFHFHLGELVEQEGVLGTLVKHTKRVVHPALPVSAVVLPGKPIMKMKLWKEI